MAFTLRDGNREYFYQKLDQHFPGLKEKYHSKYGYRYDIKSDRNEKLMRIFYQECRAKGIVCNNDDIFRYLHTYEERLEIEQIKLF